ncbi:hypothetical protein SUDANB121_02318 [Nocardiopsis dassonvillei]|uniref:hypothetical protein n=1 Tax=Nocardiopsis dassonvillei TaxID=2014 RepID=UPI003F54F06E
MSEPPPQNPPPRHPRTLPAPAQPVPPGRPSNVLGVLMIVFGVLTGLLGLLVLALPYMLFLLGGGGDVAGFDDFVGPFRYTGWSVALLGLAMSVFGTVRTVSRGRARRRWDRTYRRTP